MGVAGGPGTFDSCGNSNTGGLLSVAINDSNWVVGGGYAGYSGGGIDIIQLAPGSSTVQHITCSATGGSGSAIFGAGLNNSGLAITGGSLNGNRYAILFNVENPSSFTEITNFPFSSGGQFLSVSINESGTSLVGGQDNNGNAYAGFVQPTGEVEAPLSGAPLPAPGTIKSVDITDGFGFALIG
ncbi:MAG: hypothetical protein HYZ48_01915, partial [Chlamydiales bacterium]|nr:hypothetical protein [Chlamydiales bacterium]